MPIVSTHTARPIPIFLLGAMTLLAAPLVCPLVWADSTTVKRGEYLTRGFGCADCHTPLVMGANGPEPDLARDLSGHPAHIKVTPLVLPKGNWAWVGAASNTAFQGPWGISYAVNLTPDMETGMGKWTERQFVAALKTGKHVGVSRPILPPMPWQALSTLTDGDLKAIFAYLRSIPAVSNRVPEPTPPAEQVAGR